MKKIILGLVLGAAAATLVLRLLWPALVGRIVAGEFKKFIDADPSLVFHAYNDDAMEQFIRYSVPEYAPHLSPKVMREIAGHIRRTYAARLDAATRKITGARALAAYLVGAGVLPGRDVAAVERELAAIDPARRHLPPKGPATEYHSFSGGIPGARVAAEWEPMDGSFIGWPCYLAGNWTTAARLVAAVAEKATAFVIVPDAAWQQAVELFLQTHGYDREAIRFLHIRNDDVWARDWGPICVRGGDGAYRFVVNPYVIAGQPHYKYDAEIALRLGGYLGVPVHKVPLVVEGGNIITDGRGTFLLSDSVLYQNPDVERAELDRLLAEYYGAQKVILLPRLPGEVTGHVDGIVKVLAEDSLMVTRFEPGHKWYDLAEDWAARLARETSAHGRPYRIVRIATPTPPRDYQTWTYINSLTLNGRVIVPVYGDPKDEEALATYRAAMPGFEVVGIPYNAYVVGAVHCQTKEIPAPLAQAWLP